MLITDFTNSSAVTLDQWYICPDDCFSLSHWMDHFLYQLPGFQMLSYRNLTDHENEAISAFRACNL